MATIVQQAYPLILPEEKLARIDVGTNIMQGLFVNDELVAGITPVGLYLDLARYGTLSHTVAGDTAYVVGTIIVNSVEIVIDARCIAIASVGTIAGERLTEMRFTIDDTARVQVEGIA